MKKRNTFQIIILILLLAWYGFFLLHKVDLTTADLGRHIKNGEMVLKGDFGILGSNFYSYTEPNFPVVNHHWGSGVIFYLIWKIFGFKGLSFFYLLISLIIFYLFFRLAEKESNFNIPLIVSLLVIPLIAQRTEIRPEIFSYLFIALFIWILWHWQKGKLDNKWLFVLPVLELIWVNTHIYFVFGFGLVGLFWLNRTLKIYFTKNKIMGMPFKILGLTVLATLINPFTWKGLIYPFNIFRNYGYRIVENQSVWFLERLGIINNPNLALFKIVFIILVLSFVLVLIRNRKSFSFIYFCLAVFFSALGWFAIRNFTIFGFFALLIISFNFNKVLKIKMKSLNAKLAFAFVSLAILLISFTIYSQKLPLNKYIFGLGIISGNNQSIEFFKDKNIQGPIFNNYDIGGYLIFHLYPQEKVFTDNRPEAYSISFFEDIYIPAQQNDSVWQEQMEKYDFNSIFFMHRDYTPWGQKFLIERVKDLNWVPVYYDSFAIIFLKRNDLNKEIIKDYEIPQSYFRTD